MNLQFGNRQAEAVLDALAKWLPGRATQIQALRPRCVMGLSVTLAPIQQRHSDAQRGAYWSALHQLGRELGYSTRETESLLHPVICAEAFGQAGVREIDVGGRSYSWPVPAETSSRDSAGRVRDRETYGQLIDTLLRMSAELGVMVEIER